MTDRRLSAQAGSALAAIALGLLAGACVAAPPPLSLSPRTGVAAPAPEAPPQFRAQCGLATWYAMTGRTASGEHADPAAMTAAHRSLAFGTSVQVTNLDNGRRAVVRINDRGPFVPGRIIDVSRAAAERLGFVAGGAARVRIDAADGARSGPPADCS